MNKTIKFFPHAIRASYIPEMIKVNIIEIPPHSRTLKIHSIIDRSIYSIYYKIPYTQFYFTELKYDCRNGFVPITFITNTLTPIQLCQQPSRPVFYNCNWGMYGRICWGKYWEYDENPTPNELISRFWNSKFDHDPIPLPLYETEFEIL